MISILKKAKFVPLEILLLSLLLLAGIYYPFTVFIFITVIIFLFIALKSLQSALFIMLATHPITRDGLVISIDIFDVHYIYILQLIIIIVWFFENKWGIKKNSNKEIKFLFKIILFSLLFAIISTVMGGISKEGIREILKYSLDILTAYVIFKIVSSDIKSGLNIIIKWIKVVFLIAVISFFMSLFFSEPFPSYRIEFKNFQEVTEYRPPQPFDYITANKNGVESYNRLEIGFGSPYGSYPGLLMVALVVALSPLVEHIKFKEFPQNKFYVFSIILFLVTILTYTRSAWVGLMAGVFVLFMFTKYKTRVIKISLPVFLLLTILRPATIMDRLIQINVDSSESSVVSHLETFQIAENAIYSHPVLGVGYANLIGTGNMSDISRGRGVVHSAFLQQWAELGTVGLILFLFMPSYLFYITKINEKNIKLPSVIINRGVVSALVALIVQSIFIPGLDVIFWILLGFSLAFNTQLLENSTPQKTVQTII